MSFLNKVAKSVKKIFKKHFKKKKKRKKIVKKTAKKKSSLKKRRKAPKRKAKKTVRKRVKKKKKLSIKSKSKKSLKKAKKVKKKPLSKKKKKKVAVSKKSIPAVEGDLIGEVTHYFSKIQVVVVKITKATICVGDMVHIAGANTSFKQRVNSLQIESLDVKVAKKGQLIGMKVAKIAKPKDKVYKIV